MTAPCRDGRMSLEACLARRRSSRIFDEQRLSLPELSQLLWAAQGITSAGGLRTSPSAKAVYPLRVDLVSFETDLEPGVYRYDPDKHILSARFTADLRDEMLPAALGQEVVEFAPAFLVFSASYRGMLREFGDRGIRLAQIEAGHAAQNVCLEATALELSCLGMGVFDDAAMKKVLRLADHEEPLYLLALGHA